MVKTNIKFTLQGMAAEPLRLVAILLDISWRNEKMEHQKQIAYQKIDNLHSGIAKAEELVNVVRQMHNHENADLGQVQKELEEIQDFLSWLAQQ